MIINALNTWQLNALLGMIFSVLFYQFYKLAIKTSKNNGSFLILLQLVAGISILPFIPFFTFKLLSDWRLYALLIVVTVLYAVNDRLQAEARKEMDISASSIVDQLVTVFLMVSGFLFFGEQVFITKLLGLFFILAGNVNLFYKRGKFYVNKYVGFAILTNIVFATSITIDIGLSQNFNLPAYISFTLLMPALLIKIIEKVAVKNLVSEYSQINKFYVGVSGVSWSLFILFTLRAYQFGKITTIVPIMSSKVFINVIIAYIFLKERDGLLRKMISAVAVMIGIYLTVLK